jgi:EAL and modified HD-GYP domain-containing signal transduction protein
VSATARTALPTQALLARHPILDTDERVRGHELVWGDADGPAERATARALLAATTGGDLAALTGGRPAWVRMSPAFLLALDPLPLPPGALVLQVQPGPDADDDDALVARLRALRAAGHQIALDGYLPGERFAPLLPFADHVKVDLAIYGVDGLRPVLESLPYDGPNVVATNVETPDQADACVRRGIDLLQGFFFERPRSVEDVTPPAGPATDRLRALVALRNRPAFEDVERIIAADPGLTVRLMRFANSAAVGARRTFATVRDALILLGAERVRQFLLLLLLAEVGAGRNALVGAAVLRGRLCETIARDLEVCDPASAFTAGVLSVLDALLERPMAVVLSTVPVSDELRWALLAHSGPVGGVLDLAIGLERSRGDVPFARFERLGEAVAWTEAALADLG